MEIDYTAVIVAIAASIPGIAALIAQSRRDRLDSAKLALDMCDDLNKEVTALKEEIIKLQTHINVKDARIAELEKMVAERDARIDDLEHRLEIVEGQTK